MVVVVLGVVAVGGAARARGDVLYALSSTGLLRAIDPETGTVIRRTQIHTPGKIAAGGAGLGAVPGGGPAYALVGLGDDCGLDPTRTLFAGGDPDGCAYMYPRDKCEQSFVVTWGGQPVSCSWIGGGCEACRASCPNTCAPPPPCLGKPDAQWAGFGAQSCRRFDGDSAGCTTAYYSDETGTFTCFESAGLCLACDPAAQVAGVCTYGCQPAGRCADGSRDVFVGSYYCWILFDDAAACERAFQSDGGAGTMACVVGSDGYCTWCDVNGEAEGFCSNTCAPEPPACRGDPARVPVPVCYANESDPMACGQSYTTAPEGGPAACFVNGNGSCVACTRSAEEQGWCANACAPAICAADPDRSTLLAPPTDCHALDGDPTACATAYFVGRCGVSSCHYDVAASVCRPCTVDDPERCENACGAFEGLDFQRAPALVAVDLFTGGGFLVGSPGDWFNQPAPDVTGVVHALSWAGNCVESGLFRLDPSDLRPSQVTPLTGLGGGALSLHPDDGRLYRLAADGVFVTDPVTGLTTSIAVDVPLWLDPRAMTWAPACNAFLVADGFDGLWRLDPVTGTLEKTALHLEGECDEGDCATGLVLDGTAVCPPFTFPTSTTTITTTSTSSSTSTSTLPSELLTGRRLLLTDDPAKPKKRRLKVRSDDPSISLGSGEGSADDPVQHGGGLRVVATSGTFDASYALTDGWRYMRKAGRLKGYEWRGGGPARKIVLRPGRLDVQGKGAALMQTLVTDPGAVQVVLQLGSRRWCLEFGGTFDARTPEKLRAHDAPAPKECATP